jgi:CHAT domain-containing protein
LTAEEVTSLDLRGMDLAVLSACDTGRGTVETGEGVLGLRQSLEMAGVRTVVMSVWPVPDREARRWMAAFYESILAGTPIGEATRRASLAGLERLRSDGIPAHPYLWGGFVVAGDWR